MLMLSLLPLAAGVSAEPACLLQKPKAPNQLSQLAETPVPGWEYAGKGDCLAKLQTFNEPDPTSCASQCSYLMLAFSFDSSRSSTCFCCQDLALSTSYRSFAYARAVRKWDFIGTGKRCQSPLASFAVNTLNDCTFSLWHLHGLSTEFQTQDGFKKVPVEWEIFTHYSGHQSFTKGLLLIDRSAGVQRQVLEITSQDCQWRAHTGAEWTMVSKPGMISVAEGQDYVTCFNMTKTNGRKHRGGHASQNQLNLNQVHLSMNSKDGATDIAVLTVSCRPKRNLNLNLVMKRRSDHGFVEGELAGGKKLAALETDSEFNIKGKWQDVGGSDQAAAYLRQMDEDSSLHVSLLQSCTAEDKVQAKITCSKYLDSLGHLDPAGFFLNDCIYDICHGAGEVAAELAAELLTSASV